jgi:membrane protein DedA with SNARE-associated domain
MQSLVDYLATLPVEWFVLIGAFVQELISPLPSFVVFVPAGASLAAHGQAFGYVVLMSVLAAVGRVAAALLLYWLSETIRQRVFARRRRWLGVRRRDLQKLERYLNTTKSRSWMAIFALWVVPVVPGLLISLAGGFTRMPVGVFASATFAGAIINALIYLVIGYYGLQVVAPFGTNELGLLGGFCALVIVAIIIALRRKEQ